MSVICRWDFNALCIVGKETSANRRLSSRPGHVTIIAMFFNNPNLKSGTDQQDTQKKMKEEPAVEKVEAKEETKADEKSTPVKEETVKEETVNKSEVAINEESGTSPITTDGEKDDTPKPEPSEETTTTAAAGEIKLSTELDDEAPKTFPQILMEILAKEEDSDTIAWLPHGRYVLCFHDIRHQVYSN